MRRSTSLRGLVFFRKLQGRVTVICQSLSKCDLVSDFFIFLLGKLLKEVSVIVPAC